MTTFPFTTFIDTRPSLGLVVLQSDETLENELRQILPAQVSLHITRVPSAPEVTRETLAEMEHHLTGAAALLPRAKSFDAVGYGCTSGTAQIGAARIAELVKAGATCNHVTEPVSALLAACQTMGLTRLAFLSPYIESVSKHLRDTLAQNSIATPVFGSFGEGDETTVAHIDSASVTAAAHTLMDGAEVDALFVSCTNLNSFEVIPPLTRELGKPVLSSNLVLGWHLLRLSGAIPHDVPPGDLLATV